MQHAQLPVRKKLIITRKNLQSQILPANIKELIDRVVTNSISNKKNSSKYKDIILCDFIKKHAQTFAKVHRIK